MTVILCPTRGGKSSLPNQEWATQLAKERNAHLIFLYVTSVSFLDHLSSPLLVDVSHELDELGEFLLDMAKDRAMQSGVNADILVRHGVFREALAQVIGEAEVDIVVIGQSTRGTGVTDERYLAILAETVRAKGVEMLVVDGGVLVRRYAAGGEDEFTDGGDFTADYIE